MIIEMHKQFLILVQEHLLDSFIQRDNSEENNEEHLRNSYAMHSIFVCFYMQAIIK